MHPYLLRAAIVASLLCSTAHAQSTRPLTCQQAPLAVQILGSGGPEFDAERAATGYVVWRHGKALAIVDAGSGTHLRFAQAGGDFNDVQAMFFTHLHADHSADFVSYIKSSYFTTRTQALQVFGPTGNAQLPSMTDHVQHLFAQPGGLYPYLSNYLKPATPDSDAYAIQAHNVDANGTSVVALGDIDGVKVSAISVEHGALPAVAWRFDVDGQSVAFTGDMSGLTGHFPKLAHDADLVVAHHAITWRHAGVFHLHMPPAVVGELAQASRAKRVVLSHRMRRTIGSEAQSLQAIREHYAGPVDFANDLDCYVP
jgi:ribonuclease BN (tRNA processing enzyme)